MDVSLLLVLFAISSLLLRAGYALHAAGLSPGKNTGAEMLRVMVETAVGALAFWAVGAVFLLGNANPYFSFDPGLLFRTQPATSASELFHLVIALTGTAVIGGALAGRARFYVGVIASVVLCGVVIPICGHWAWYGWLASSRWLTVRFIDVGGASVIHLSAAVFAAIGVAVVGSRAGKYNRDGSVASLPGHSMPLLGTGTLLIFIGWFPYLLGSVTAHAGQTGSTENWYAAGASMNLMLAAAGGIVGALLYSQVRRRKPDVIFICSGLLCAMVAISSGVAAVDNLGALVIGLVAGLFVPSVSLMLERRFRLDDPSGLIAVHGFGAVWGTLATAVLIDTGDGTLGFAWRFRLLGVQSLGLAVVLLTSGLVGTILFSVLRVAMKLRITETGEV